LNVSSPLLDGLPGQIAARHTRAGMTGPGHAGLPPAMAPAREGFAVTGFDVDRGSIDYGRTARSAAMAIGTRSPSARRGLARPNAAKA
jgi:UDP-N-acetyl-D-glucosamine dehydrogenase